MAIEIVDGTGTGYKAEVNEAKQLEVRSVDILRSEWECHNNSLAFCMKFDVAAANSAADEALLYIKNARDKDMIIDEIRFILSAANIVYAQFVTGTAGGTPTTLYPANMHGGQSKDTESTFYQDDALSGLTAVTDAIVMWEYCAAADVRKYKPTSTVLIPKNQALAVYVETQQAQTLQGVILYHYENAH
jgi:hypothetical protein